MIKWIIKEIQKEIVSCDMLITITKILFLLLVCLWILDNMKDWLKKEIWRKES